MPGYLCVSQVPPKLSELFEHHEASVGALCGQMVGGADAGNACAHDQNVEVLSASGGKGLRVCPVHGSSSKLAILEFRSPDYSRPRKSAPDEDRFSPMARAGGAA